MLSNEFKINQALTETVTAFDPQLQAGGFDPNGWKVPEGVELKDGKVILKYYAPNAKSVAVRKYWSEGPIFPMERTDDGTWICEWDFADEKYYAIFFEVDGTYCLNPMAPVGWSQSHPVNYLDLPAEGIDYYLMKDVPHGTVARDMYWSDTCDCFKGCYVYTPPGYNLGKYDKLPVLYLQHGFGENETSWVHLGKVNFIMDNLLAEGKAEPCIIVMNTGMVQTEAKNGTRTWNPMTLEPLLLNDCIPYIESHYRVLTDKWNRAMAGLSMGSMQTSVITLSHPDMFGYAGIFSGFLGKLGGITDTVNEHFKAFDDLDALRKNYKIFFRAMGDKDDFFGQFKSEGEMLREKGLAPGDWEAHREVIYPGPHDWNVWRPSVRDYLQLIFK
jgi:enterochelin esterase family protein